MRGNQRVKYLLIQQPFIQNKISREKTDKKKVKQSITLQAWTGP
jgi:hypothetical protein